MAAMHGRACAWMAACLAVAGCGGASTTSLTSSSTSVSTRSTSTTPAPPAGAWTMYHRDPSHTGDDPSEPPFTSLTRAWATPPLDGAIFAEPLVLGSRVFTATENDTVYALDAVTGAVAWTKHLAIPVPKSKFPGCGDIVPLGITSTPVIDVATSTILVVAFEDPGGDAPGRYHLVGLDVASGNARFDRDITPATMDTSVHQQRAALALSGGVVYVAWGGLNGDCGAYHGWIVGSRADGSGPAVLYEYQVPSSARSGMWAPSGPVVDSAGSVYMTTGNAASSSACDTGNTVYRWSPSLAVADSWAPSDCIELNRADADLGSAGPVLVDSGRLFQAGKQNTGYLLSTAALGNSPVTVDIGCSSFGGDAVNGSLVVVPCNEGLVGVNTSSTPSVAWRATTKDFYGAPIVAGGVIWAIGVDKGILYGFATDTGAVIASAPLGGSHHFVTPSTAGGRLFASTDNGIVAFSGI